MDALSITVSKLFVRFPLRGNGIRDFTWLMQHHFKRPKLSRKELRLPLFETLSAMGGRGATRDMSLSMRLLGRVVQALSRLAL
jgi:hypothetical protein